MIFVSDTVCGLATNAGPRRGLFGDNLVAQAQVTLPQGTGGRCNYSLSECFPLGQVGNITLLGIQVAFESVSNFPLPRSCRMTLSSVNMTVAVCGFEGFNPNFDCTSPANGGACGYTNFQPNLVPDYQSQFNGFCKGVASFSEAVLFEGFLEGLRITGSPKRRDIGNVECVTVSSDPLNEVVLHTTQARVVVRLV
jgi:hypothetical protein